MNISLCFSHTSLGKVLIVPSSEILLLRDICVTQPVQEVVYDELLRMRITPNT